MNTRVRTTEKPNVPVSWKPESCPYPLISEIYASPHKNSSRFFPKYTFRASVCVQESPLYPVKRHPSAKMTRSLTELVSLYESGLVHAKNPPLPVQSRHPTITIESDVSPPFPPAPEQEKLTFRKRDSVYIRLETPDGVDSEFPFECLESPVPIDGGKTMDTEPAARRASAISAEGPNPLSRGTSPNPENAQGISYGDDPGSFKRVAFAATNSQMHGGKLGKWGNVLFPSSMANNGEESLNSEGGATQQKSRKGKRALSINVKAKQETLTIPPSARQFGVVVSSPPDSNSRVPIHLPDSLGSPLFPPQQPLVRGASSDNEYLEELHLIVPENLHFQNDSGLENSNLGRDEAVGQTPEVSIPRSMSKSSSSKSLKPRVGLLSKIREEHAVLVVPQTEHVPHIASRMLIPQLPSFQVQRSKSGWKMKTPDFIMTGKKTEFATKKKGEFVVSNAQGMNRTIQFGNADIGEETEMRHILESSMSGEPLHRLVNDGFVARKLPPHRLAVEYNLFRGVRKMNAIKVQLRRIKRASQ